jgi:hypothetical protein
VCASVPQQVRAAATDFVRVLYLDRYPQMKKCGRPSLPESLWVYDLGHLEGNAHLDFKALPLVREISLDDESKQCPLPAFSIPKSHYFSGDKDPFNGKITLGHASFHSFTCFKFICVSSPAALKVSKRTSNSLFCATLRTST